MKTLLTETQLAERKYRIGSSEVPIIMGVKPGLAELWAEKSGRREREFGGNRFTEWGNRLEGAVAEAYAEQYAAPLEMVGGETWVHPTCQWAQATPDRLLLDATGVAQRGLEIKTTTDPTGWGPDGSTKIPGWVEWQVRWQMWVTGLDRWDVAVLINGSDFRAYTLSRDKEKEGRMVATVTSFWFTNVKGEVPPDGYRALPWKDATTSGVVREADGEERALMGDILSLRAAKAQIEDRLEDLEYQLKRRVGSDEGLTYGDTTMRWTPVRGRTSVDWKAVSRQVMDKVDPTVYTSIVEANTSEGRPYRRLLITLPKEKLGGNDALQAEASEAVDGHVP